MRLKFLKSKYFWMIIFIGIAFSLLLFKISNGSGAGTGEGALFFLFFIFPFGVEFAFINVFIIFFITACILSFFRYKIEDSHYWIKGAILLGGISSIPSLFFLLSGLFTGSDFLILLWLFLSFVIIPILFGAFIGLIYGIIKKYA